VERLNRPTLPSISVLLADDDALTRQLLGRLIPGAPRLAEAADGYAAIEKFTSDPPDLVLMDLDMPVMSGLEAVRKMRAWEREAGRAPSAIVALSSFAGDDVRAKCLAAGFDRYLEKPVSPDVLLRTLSELLAPGAAPLGTADLVSVRSMLKNALPGFLDSRRGLLEQLERELAAGKAAPARALAHKLAGSFALYGFHWAAGRCKMIERRAAACALEGLATEVAELLRHLDTVRVEIAE